MPGRLRQRIARHASAAAAVVLLAGAAAAQPPPAAEPPRYALVIGNSRYAEVSALPNVANDLADMCAALQRLRFRATCLADVPDRKAFMDAVARFVADVPAGASMVVYFGGHALQVAGENFLIPVKASAADARGWLPQFVRLSELFQASEAAHAGFQFIALDACRDDPDGTPPQPTPHRPPQRAQPGSPAPAQAQTATRAAAERAAGREALRSMLASVRGTSARPASYGIGAVRDAPRNTLVLFATGAGTTAFDGQGERNGPMTKHLMVQMQRSNLHIDQVIKNVIQAVGDDTERRYGRRQSPALYGTFSGEFCFNGCPQVVGVEVLEQERRQAAERERAERERRDRERREQERQRRETIVVPTI